MIAEARVHHSCNAIRTQDSGLWTDDLFPLTLEQAEMQMWSQGFASDSPQQLNSGSVHSEALPAGHLVRRGPASQQSIDKCFSNAPGNALFKKLSVLDA